MHPNARSDSICRTRTGAATRLDERDVADG